MHGVPANVVLLLLFSAFGLWPVASQRPRPVVTDSDCRLCEQAGKKCYFSGARHCCMCRPGYHLSEHCRHTDDTHHLPDTTVCVPCETGTYMPRNNNETACLESRDSCEALHYTRIERGNATTDSRCVCTAGTYSKNPGDAGCKPYLKCPKGFGVIFPGNRTHDVKCSGCGKNTFSDVDSSTMVCRTHRSCGKGEKVLFEGDQTRDRECGNDSNETAAGSRNPTTTPLSKFVAPVIPTSSAPAVQSQYNPIGDIVIVILGVICVFLIALVVALIRCKDNLCNLFTSCGGGNQDEDGGNAPGQALLGEGNEDGSNARGQGDLPARRDPDEAGTNAGRQGDLPARRDPDEAGGNAERQGLLEEGNEDGRNAQGQGDLPAGRNPDEVGGNAGRQGGNQDEGGGNAPGQEEDHDEVDEENDKDSGSEGKPLIIREKQHTAKVLPKKDKSMELRAFNGKSEGVKNAKKDDVNDPKSASDDASVKEDETSFSVRKEPLLQASAPKKKSVLSPLNPQASNVESSSATQPSSNARFGDAEGSADREAPGASAESPPRTGSGDAGPQASPSAQVSTSRDKNNENREESEFSSSPDEETMRETPIQRSPNSVDRSESQSLPPLTAEVGSDAGERVVSPNDSIRYIDEQEDSRRSGSDIDQHCSPSRVEQLGRPSSGPSQVAQPNQGSLPDQQEHWTELFDQAKDIASLERVPEPVIVAALDSVKEGGAIIRILKNVSSSCLTSFIRDKELLEELVIEDKRRENSNDEEEMRRKLINEIIHSKGRLLTARYLLRMTKSYAERSRKIYDELCMEFVRRVEAQNSLQPYTAV